MLKRRTLHRDMADVNVYTARRLKSMALSLGGLAQAFADEIGGQGHLTKEDGLAAMQTAASAVCGDCTRCNLYYGSRRDDSYYLYYLLRTFEQKGKIDLEDMPRLFHEICSQREAYLRELNRSLGRATMNLGWKNRFLESRDAVIVQFRELAAILEEFSNQMEQAADVVSLTGILSAKFSPGNTLRFEKNVESWFPNFVHLNPFQKIGLGILETGDGIFSVSFGFIFVFLIVLVVLSFYKKNFISLILSSFTLFAILSQKFEWRNILFTLSSVSKVARESGTFDYNVVYFGAVIYNIVLFMILMYSLWTLSKVSDRLWIIYLFGIGLIGRLLISFSPTLYASSTRTYLPIMLSLFIITCYFLNDIYIHFKRSKAIK